MKTTRRSFLKTGTIVSSGLFLPINTFSTKHKQMSQKYSGNELLRISYDLLQTWCNGLVSLQIQAPNMLGLQGGIVCPACSRVHGRIGYAIYPLMFMADSTKDERYLNSALQLYDWMESAVSFPDGSWVNDVNVSLWKGITVCTAITLAETLMQHEHLLDQKTYKQWRLRLIKASDYLYENFNIYTGNINYPATCSYALSLIGEFLDVKKYRDKGKQLGNECKHFFSTNNHFLFGEGKPQDLISPKGCRFIDLGYNVEESLPSLVLYGQLVNDEEILELVTKSLKTHAEFMLPDGAWDNSWGSRSFKWSYWGGTTSDGCQHAYALLAERVPEFYNIALQNTKLQQACTFDNVIYGGLHTKQHGLQPCVHPTFTHVKALATMLNHSSTIEDIKVPERISLPRSQDYGVKEFKDIQTWLVAKHGWNGTITGYDMDYEGNTGGHPSGGALSMLYHAKTGPVIVGSMTRYQMIEAANMQMETDQVSMPLTPRLELDVNGSKYMNICDHKAEIDFTENENEVVFSTRSRLVDEAQKNTPTGEIPCNVKYTFRKNEIVLSTSHNSENKTIKYVVPIISSNDEKVVWESDRKLKIFKDQATLIIESNHAMQFIKTEKSRIFNFIPGMEALPIEISGQRIEIKISVA